jgi:hypothetical protein
MRRGCLGSRGSDEEAQRQHEASASTIRQNSICLAEIGRANCTEYASTAPEGGPSSLRIFFSAQTGRSMGYDCRGCFGIVRHEETTRDRPPCQHDRRCGSQPARPNSHSTTAVANRFAWVSSADVRGRLRGAVRHSPHLRWYAGSAMPSRPLRQD